MKAIEFEHYGNLREELVYEGPHTTMPDDVGRIRLDLTATVYWSRAHGMLIIQFTGRRSNNGYGYDPVDLDETELPLTDLVTTAHGLPGLIDECVALRATMARHLARLRDEHLS